MASIFLIVLLSITIPSLKQQKTEILWDTYGIPHIYAKDNSDLFKAFGWAQAQSHGNLILQLYGQARGKAAEYWGPKYFDSDEYVVKMGIPTNSLQWYDSQSPEMQSYLDAFAQGINQYIMENPDDIEEKFKEVLPISGVDILAHIQRTIYYHFLISPNAIANLKTQGINATSNAWAIAPSRSLNGNSLLLANPHLPWRDLYLWYEAQLTAPGIDAYGAALVGMPMLSIAFNDNLGWTLSMNNPDAADIYELTLAENGYVYNGEIRPFEEEKQVIKVGKIIEKEVVVKKSIHGPIIAEKGNKAYALRVAGEDKSSIMEQFFQMAKANNLEEFETALKQLQLPLFNIVYADKKGQIMYVFNGLIPKRNDKNEDGSQILAGDTSDTLWTEYHGYEELPRLLNPTTGWLQNTNDPPWSSTFPSEINSKDYPSYFAPSSLAQAEDLLRTQKSIKLLKDREKMDLDEMISLKFDSQLEAADRLLEYLIPAARLLGNPLGKEAAEVLAKWNGQSNADSRGAVLFTLWANSLDSSNLLFGKPWNETNPLDTPTGLKDFNIALGVLEGVAAQVKLLYGSLDVPWGEVVSMGSGAQQLPASGGLGKLGSFQVVEIAPTNNEKFKVVAGDSYIAAIEFSQPVKAKSLTVYGNSSQPNSLHNGDGLPLYASKELHDVWRKPREVKSHLEFITNFDRKK